MWGVCVWSKVPTDCLLGSWVSRTVGKKRFPLSPCYLSICQLVDLSTWCWVNGHIIMDDALLYSILCALSVFWALLSIVDRISDEICWHDGTKCSACEFSGFFLLRHLFNPFHTVVNSDTIDTFIVLFTHRGTFLLFSIVLLLPVVSIESIASALWSVDWPIDLCFDWLFDLLLFDLLLHFPLSLRMIDTWL